MSRHPKFLVELQITDLQILVRNEIPVTNVDEIFRYLWKIIREKKLPESLAASFDKNVINIITCLL